MIIEIPTSDAYTKSDGGVLNQRTELVQKGDRIMKGALSSSAAALILGFSVLISGSAPSLALSLPDGVQVSPAPTSSVSTNPSVDPSSTPFHADPLGPMTGDNPVTDTVVDKGAQNLHKQNKRKSDIKGALLASSIAIALSVLMWRSTRKAEGYW